MGEVAIQVMQRILRQGENCLIYNVMKKYKYFDI